MIENKKEFKSTIEAFIQAKREIKSIVNNKEAFNFKFANLVVVQEEVNRVLENKGLDMISMEHIETEHFPRIYKTWDKINKNFKDTTAYVSKGTATYIIGSIWDNETLKFVIPADFENGKPHDATYGANSISYRYFLLRAFGIPTMDEDEARLKDKQEQEQNKNNASKLIKAVEEVRQESERSKLLNQLKSLQVNIEDGENKLKTLLGLDKEEKIRQQQIMSLNEKDLKVLIERMEN